MIHETDKRYDAENDDDAGDRRVAQRPRRSTGQEEGRTITAGPTDARTSPSERSTGHIYGDGGLRRRAHRRPDWRYMVREGLRPPAPQVPRLHHGRSTPRVRRAIFNTHLSLPSDHIMVGMHVDLSDTRCHLQAQGPRLRKDGAQGFLRQRHPEHDDGPSRSNAPGPSHMGTVRRRRTQTNAASATERSLHRQIASLAISEAYRPSLRRQLYGQPQRIANEKRTNHLTAVLRNLREGGWGKRAMAPALSKMT